jgi:hypothetical protein
MVGVTEFLVVTTLVSLAISAAALIVAVRAFRNDQGTRADTSRVAAEANELQARMLSIEEGRRLDEMAPDVGLSFDPVYPDPKFRDSGRLLLTYEGSAPCERLVIEEVRGARWAPAVLEIVRHAPHTAPSGVTSDILTHLEPGETRPFVVYLDPSVRGGEIVLRLTATVDGREFPPIVRSVHAKPPPPGPNIW